MGEPNSFNEAINFNPYSSTLTVPADLSAFDLAIIPKPAVRVPETLPIDKEAQLASNARIEQNFRNAMQKRADFILQFELETGMELHAARRDSGAETELPGTFAKANHGALTLLLEAWWRRLGIVEGGWTRYSERNTITAIHTLREILEKGDEGLGIPIEALEDKEAWLAKLAHIKWWFFGLSIAFDFLAAYGIGSNKVGSGVSRVDFLRYSKHGACIHGAEHNRGMAAWHLCEIGEIGMMFPNFRPPSKPCGCYEYKLLLKTIANMNKSPAPGDERTMRYVGDRIMHDWIRVNPEDNFGEAEPPNDPEASNPAIVIMGTEAFTLRYFQEKDDAKELLLGGIRVEGRFGQLL
jgi:hypothetical protein